MASPGKDWHVTGLANELFEQHGGWDGLTGQLLLRLYQDAADNPRQREAVLHLIRRAQVHGRSQLAGDAVIQAHRSGDGRTESQFLGAAWGAPELFEPLYEVLLRELPFNFREIGCDGQPLDEFCADLDESRLPVARREPRLPLEVAVCLAAIVQLYGLHQWDALQRCIDCGRRYAAAAGGSMLSEGLLLACEAEVQYAEERFDAALQALVDASARFADVDDPLLLAYSECRRGDLLRTRIHDDDSARESAVAALRAAWDAVQRANYSTRLDSLVPYLLASLLMMTLEQDEEVDTLLAAALQARSERYESDHAAIRAAEDQAEVLQARVVRSLITQRWQAAGEDLAAFCEVLNAEPNHIPARMEARLARLMKSLFARVSPAHAEAVLAATGNQRGAAGKLTGIHTLRDVP